MGDAHLPSNWANILNVELFALLSQWSIGILCQSSGASNEKGLTKK